MTAKTTATRFSTEFWAQFWEAPDLTREAGQVLDPDIVGHWPGEPPVRGLGPYLQRIQALLDAVPDLRLELVDHAEAVLDGEELFFMHYIGRGTGPAGPFKIRGIDRMRTRDGRVVENLIRFDPAEMANPFSTEPTDRHAV